MTAADLEWVARLAAATDVIATRLRSLIERVRALPADSVAVAAAQADAESLVPYVEILERIGTDPADPVPEASDLPKATVPAVTLTPVTMADGSDMPAPGHRTQP